eukprot:CAMPEP_0114229152 /NCGR_PEP_ID=MMETSP0058-20121206/2746_1 /TAXON_ID=36894 /ORGANISM="Pyramimonas parkeae, CCMP726" /LENGTH=170 /DNA_ID=CAMNT_0001340191 /DNA_START=654 /DNA_END=1167 /DNA_ORIENTATION=+
MPSGPTTCMLKCAFIKDRALPTFCSQLPTLQSAERFHSDELAALTSLSVFYVCDVPGLCGDVPAGVVPSGFSSCSAGATSGTLLGSDCPSLTPSASPSFAPTVSSAPTSSPTASPTESTIFPPNTSGKQPLKENWFRKRDAARIKAFPQRHSWFRKQAKLKVGMGSNTTV